MLKTYTYDLRTGTSKRGKPVIIRAKVDAEDEEDALDKIHKEIKCTQEAVFQSVHYKLGKKLQEEEKKGVV